MSDAARPKAVRQSKKSSAANDWPNLVHYQEIAGVGLRLIRLVSLRDSIRILQQCARLEPRIQPAIKVNPQGWERWLSALLTCTAHIRHG
jgi:hypothetical protein